MRLTSDEKARIRREVTPDAPKGTAARLARELGVNRATITKVLARDPDAPERRGRPKGSYARGATWAEQFAGRTERQANGCLVFTGPSGSGGYGVVRVQGESHGAHRASYALHHGLTMAECPPVIMHSCDTPACVEPSHLGAGTRALNNADRHLKGRTHAKLTAAQVEEIRGFCASGEWGAQAAMARKFGVTRSAISSVVSGGTWDGEAPGGYYALKYARMPE